MANKIKAAHDHIAGPVVAEMILNFWREFDGVYGNETMHSNLCAVGPLQSMIGLAISNGLLAVPEGISLTAAGREKLG